MARTFFGLGARGPIVGQIQRALDAAGHHMTIDEVYGEDTLDAVVAFQGQMKLPITGTIDAATWTALTHSPIPAVSERSLGLTAAFEGHGYTLAKGNFDGAWMTWGIIGFTLKSGQIQQIVKRVAAAHPEILASAFGANAQRLMDVIAQPAPQQKAWATSVTVNGGDLAPAWKQGFARFGSAPEVQAEQLKQAMDGYYKPAMNLARSLGISTELGFALLFDIQVQNGGIDAACLEQVREHVADSKDAREITTREIIAEVVSADCAPKWRDDVKARKMAIATGKGTVHGREYELGNWGLAEVAG